MPAEVALRVYCAALRTRGDGEQRMVVSVGCLAVLTAVRVGHSCTKIRADWDLFLKIKYPVRYIVH